MLRHVTGDWLVEDVWAVAVGMLVGAKYSDQQKIDT